MKLLRTLSALLLAGVAKAEGKSCRALAMSGGGSKGSFEAGVMWGLVQNDPEPSKYEWDVVTGVSAGSLNAAIVTGFEIGKEKEMTEWISDFFANTANSDAYKQWKIGGMVRGLTDKAGVFDISPAYDLVSNAIKDLGTVKRKFGVSAVDVNTGAYVVWNETLAREEQYRAFMSSALIPGVFEPDHWGDYVLMDGGTVWNTNLVTAVQRCREQVDDDSEITVDIIVCGYPNLDQNWEFQNHAINNWLRYKDISDYHKDTRDVAEFMQAFPNVNFRYFVPPSEYLPGNGLGMLDFSNDTSTWPMQMIGRQDGENALQSGEGFLFGKIKEWNESPSLQAEFPKVGEYVHHVNKIQK